MKNSIFACGAVLALSAGAAFAETAIAVNGVGSGTAINEVTRLNENHILVKGHSNWTNFEMADPTHPFVGMLGECFGNFEIKAAAALGNGNCVFGDEGANLIAWSFVVTGMTPEGAITGTWATIGGQGKFEGASGGGGFESLIDRDTGTFVNAFTGAMTMK